MISGANGIEMPRKMSRRDIKSLCHMLRYTIEKKEQKKNPKIAHPLHDPYSFFSPTLTPSWGSWGSSGTSIHPHLLVRPPCINPKNTAITVELMIITL